ncbi:MAG: membrane-bound lytic murein transglycosylase A [Bacteroidia bacterium]|jgi:membrane-bound lytic murein transglycosylase A
MMTGKRSKRADAQKRGSMGILGRVIVGSLALMASCVSTPDYGQGLAEGDAALLPVAKEDIPDFALDWAMRDEILPALDQSIDWIHRPHAANFYPIEGVDINRAQASLVRFRELLVNSRTKATFDRAIREEFTWYKSAGWDGRGGGVLFTGYCTPLLEGSLTKAPGYDHPLYALPHDLVKDKAGKTLGWKIGEATLPYPSRSAIENAGFLKGRGLELVWLSNPLDSFIAHVNGSAFIRLPDGSIARFGYAGKNGATYVSLGKQLIADGILPRAGLNLQRIREWSITASPAIVNEYLNRNPSYVFFQPIEGNPHGSLDVPVTARRSVATDKTLFPRGSIMFVDADLPGARNEERIPMQQFLFDQDTGGAIRTAGRADLYMGIGPAAEQMAGRIKTPGQMYYLFLK